MNLIQLGEVDPLELMENLTDASMDEGGLTGDEIEDLIDFFGPLFEDFLDRLDEYPSPLERSKQYLGNYSRTVEELLVSFDGWLNLTQVIC